MSHSSPASPDQGDYRPLFCLNPEGTNALAWFECLPKLLGHDEKLQLANGWMLSFVYDSLLVVSSQKMDDDPIEDSQVAAAWSPDYLIGFWSGFLVSVERTNTVMFQALRSKGYRVCDDFNPFENELILHEDDPAFTRTGIDALTFQTAITHYMMTVASTLTNLLGKTLPEKIRKSFIKMSHLTHPTPAMFRSILTSLFDTYLRMNVASTIMAETQISLSCSTWNGSADGLRDIAQALDRLSWQGPNEAFDTKCLLLCLRSPTFRRLPDFQDIFRDFKRSAQTVDQLSLTLMRHEANSAQRRRDTEATLAASDQARAMLAHDAMAQQFFVNQAAAAAAAVQAAQLASLQAAAAAAGQPRSATALPSGDLRNQIRGRLGRFSHAGKLWCSLCGKADTKEGTHDPGTCKTGPRALADEVRDKAAKALAAWTKKHGLAAVSKGRQTAAAAATMEGLDEEFVLVNDQAYSPGVPCHAQTHSVLPGSQPQPACSHDKCHALSHVSTSVPARESIIDSGCAPCHCAHPSAAVGPVRPSKRIVTTAHSSVTAQVTEGAGALHTRSARCPHLRLVLPGTTLFSPSFTYRALVSHNTLLKHGYKIALDEHSGVVTTPDGDTITLVVRNGLYHFPHPDLASQQALLVRKSARIANRSSSSPPGELPASPRLSPPSLGEPAAVPVPSSVLPQGEPLPVVQLQALPAPLPSIPEEPSLPPSLISNLDKWDALHRTYGHAHPNRMLKLAKAMLKENPHRPTLNTLRKWCRLRACPSCVTGAMHRPPQNKAHPPVAPRPDIDNGEGLHIDAMGAFPCATLGGYTTAFLFTDDRSSIRTAFPTHTKSCDALLEKIQEYSAASQVQLKFIRTDNEFLCEPLTTWCRQRNISLSACAPHTHVQNPKAERSVGRVKETARKDKHLAGTSDYLVPYNYVHACQTLNRQPTDSDPLDLSRSPLEIWPTAPFQHPAQPLAPWGCRSFGFVGKTTKAPNTGLRSRPGINLGLASNTSGVNIYHPDSDTVLTYGYAQYHVHVFPVKDMQLAGELAAQDGSIDPDSWRQHAIFPVSDVQDEPCSNFMSGKQIQFNLPLSAEPSFRSQWRARAHRPVYSPCGLTGLEFQFVQYLGADSELKSPKDHEFKTREVLGICLMSPAPRGVPIPKGWYTFTARQCLADTFPTCRTLADIAKASVSLAGAFPKPRALDQASQRHTTAAATFPIGRIVIPVRKVGTVRSPHATWLPVRHHVLPTRQHLLVSSTAPASSASRSTAAPSCVLALPDTKHLGFCPRSVREARTHDSWPLWEAAIDKEITGLQHRDTWTEVSESSVPSSIRIMDSKFVFADKPVTGPKVRVVVRGDQEWPKLPSSSTYSPTPGATEIRILLSAAVQNHWAVHSMDISQAFVQSDPLDPDTHYYVRPPRGYACEPGTVWKLKKPLYGLACAPKAWTTTFTKFLTDYGFVPVNGSSTMHTWTDGTAHMHLVYHVDDILLSFSSDDAAVQFKTALLSRFAGTDDGPVRRYVGVDISRDANHMHLSQEPLALELLERFDMQHCNPCTTPMEAGTLMLAKDRPTTPDPVLRRKFQECVGTLQYLATWTRPDLQFCTNELSKHLSNPGTPHWNAAKRVLRYLKGTSSLGLTYTRNLPNSNRLTAYADADWATCTETRRSVSGYVTILNGAAVSWKSKKQGAVATSTSEAEFVSASKAADEIVWARRILAALNIPQTSPTPLHEDNRSCRILSENPVHSERSKHIDFRVHALRDRVRAGDVILIDCASRDMVADSFTKNLPADAFIRHRNSQLGRHSV
jgi:hypothetical protein